MGTVNKVMLVGRLGKDPELRDNGVCKFNIATDDGRGDRDETNWHTITCFGKNAENAAKYLSKGREVHIEGRVKNNNYESDGVKHYAYEIIAERVTFLGGRQEQVATESEGGNSSEGYEPSGDDDDDLPF